jgi:hypothetical protein
MATYSASAELPFAQQERAIAVLQAKLRYQLAPGESANWSTLEVAGPIETPDRYGRAWFEWTATVRTTS